MKTELITLDNGPQDLKKIRQAADLIEDGKLVVIPTETVYGIAARVIPSAIEALNEIKSRSETKHYSLHVGSAAQIGQFVPDMPFRLRKLVQKTLPGPLTVVFDLDDEQVQSCIEDWGDYVGDVIYKEKTVGIRCPDNPVTSELLSMLHVPVVASSANLSGGEPATDAKQAMEQLDGKVAAILDAGPCREKLNSTVVKLKDGAVHILRQGSYTEEKVKEYSKVKIAFVCTGNTCRSPMAEVFFKKALAEKFGCNIDQLEDFGYKVISAGVMAMIDQPASPESIEVCAGEGIDLTQHRSKGLSESDIIESDIIFVMGESHRQRILDFYPDADVKCRLLSSKGDISDPFGGSIEIYNQCASEIKEAIEERLGEFSI